MPPYSKKLFIPRKAIAQKVTTLATMLSHNREIKKTIQKKEPPLLCIGILDAAFMFMADLTRSLPFPCEITFIKATSYQETKRKQLHIEHGLEKAKIQGKVVVLVDTIIDTGHTIITAYHMIRKMKARCVIPVCLLYKPSVYQYKKILPIRYKGLSIPDDFVVGYGLDCDGKYRTLPDIYRL